MVRKFNFTSHKITLNISSNTSVKTNSHELKTYVIDKSEVL